MKASCQEDYFKALIRLRLLWPVNPKQAPKNAIGAILWLDENLAGVLLYSNPRAGAARTSFSPTLTCA
jgi:hypothetical protein